MTTRKHPRDPEEIAASIALFEGKIAGVFVELCRGLAHRTPPLFQGLLHSGAIAQAELRPDKTFPAPVVLRIKFEDTPGESCGLSV